jgi:hypothetical protein
VTRLAWPLRPTVTGRLATVQTGSAEEVLQSAGLLLSTVRGERLAQPDYGRPDWTFDAVDVELVLQLLADAFPNVEVQVLRDVLDNAGDGWLQRVDLGLSTTVEGGS